MQPPLSSSKTFSSLQKETPYSLSTCPPLWIPFKHYQDKYWRDFFNRIFFNVCSISISQSTILGANQSIKSYISKDYLDLASKCLAPDNPVLRFHGGLVRITKLSEQNTSGIWINTARELSGLCWVWVNL